MDGRVVFPSVRGDLSWANTLVMRVLPALVLSWVQARSLHLKSRVSNGFAPFWLQFASAGFR